jgi:hypothetical protein
MAEIYCDDDKRCVSYSVHNVCGVQYIQTDKASDATNGKTVVLIKGL